jgi:hypothetical protein
MVQLKHEVFQIPVKLYSMFFLKNNKEYLPYFMRSYKKGPVLQTRSLLFTPRLRQPERNVVKSDFRLSVLIPPVKSQLQQGGGAIESCDVVGASERFYKNLQRLDLEKTFKEDNMNETPKINWPGKSGTEYQYWIYPIETTFTNGPGNYIFAKETQPGHWSPCYIGQTQNLGDRLSNHEKEACAKRKGATHIHVHVNRDGERARKAEEKDLILKWKPPCNEQLVD